MIAQGKPPAPAIDVQVFDRMPSDEYHAKTHCISNSMLSDFLRSPEYFHGRYIAKTIPSKSTPAMAFGSLFHDAVLLGLDLQAVEIPDSALSSDGHRKGKAWIDFATEHAGKSCLKRDEYAVLRNMVNAVWSHPIASRLLEPKDAAIEQSICWRDEVSGLMLRSRLDHRKLRQPIITDLKSTNDVSRRGFATSMLDYRYHTQTVFYREAAKAITGEEHSFVFVAVEKDPPHRVRCYELDPRPDRALTKGYEDFRDGLERLAECYRTNDWNEPGWNQVLTLDLPNWAYRNDYEVNCGDGD